MQSLGVFEAVNYKNQDIAEVFKDPSKHFDVVVDLVGGQHLGSSLPLALKNHMETCLHSTDCMQLSLGAFQVTLTTGGPFGFYYQGSQRASCRGR